MRKAMLPLAGLATLWFSTVASAQTGAPFGDMCMYGISRGSGTLWRHDFCNQITTSVGTVQTSAGTVLTGINGSGYVPGFQNIFGFWTDSADGNTRLVYINTKTAAAAVVGQDLGPGQVTGAVAAQGPIGGGVYFDGQVDVLEFPHKPEYLMANGTIALSFNATEVSTIQGLFSKDSSGYDTGGHVHIYIKSSRVKVRLQSLGSSYYITSNTTIQPNTWYDVAVSFGSGGMKLYLNGVEVGSRSYTGGLGTSSGGAGNHEPIVIGASAVQSGNQVSTNLKDYFEGMIAGVSIEQETLMAANGGTAWSVFAAQNTGSGPSVSIAFDIEDDTVVPTEEFAAKVSVLGAAISYGGQYDMPVTTKFVVEGQTHEPFGSFGLAVTGNVNDSQNPRDYVFPNTFPAGTQIDVIGRAWKKKYS